VRLPVLSSESQRRLNEQFIESVNLAVGQAEKAQSIIARDLENEVCP
jgi:hypothetical protein